jgi:hypothetical protein
MRFANPDCHEAFDTDAIVAAVAASVFLWTIIQCRSAIFKFVAQQLVKALCYKLEGSWFDSL